MEVDKCHLLRTSDLSPTGVDIHMDTCVHTQAHTHAYTGTNPHVQAHTFAYVYTQGAGDTTPALSNRVQATLTQPQQLWLCLVISLL